MKNERKKPNGGEGPDPYMEYLKEHHPDTYEQTKNERTHDARAARAEEHERAGNIEGAITLYEENVKEVLSSDFYSVERLAILYRRIDRYDDEIRMMELALPVIPIKRLKDRITQAALLKAKRERGLK